MDCTCVWACVLEVGGNNETQRRGRDIMARKGGELSPSQGHCTEVIFIDHSTVEGTCALICTVVEVNYNLTVTVTGSFVHCSREG